MNLLRRVSTMVRIVGSTHARVVGPTCRQQRWPCPGSGRPGSPGSPGRAHQGWGSSSQPSSLPSPPYHRGSTAWKWFGCNMLQKRQHYKLQLVRFAQIWYWLTQNDASRWCTPGKRSHPRWCAGAGSARPRRRWWRGSRGGGRTWCSPTDAWVKWSASFLYPASLVYCTKISDFLGVYWILSREQVHNHVHQNKLQCNNLIFSSQVPQPTPCSDFQVNWRIWLVFLTPLICRSTEIDWNVN